MMKAEQRGDMIILTEGDIEITVEAKDFYNYVNGTAIQEAFPYLSTSARAMILLGPSRREWQQCIKAGKI